MRAAKDGVERVQRRRDKSMFVGFYTSPETKKVLEEGARRGYRSLSDELRRIVEEAVRGPKEVQSE
jgi:hypothetical protein